MSIVKLGTSRVQARALRFRSRPVLLVHDKLEPRLGLLRLAPLPLLQLPPLLLPQPQPLLLSPLLLSLFV